MFLASIEGVENKSNYQEIKVDDKTFYQEKPPSRPRKRYSDQFKDPRYKNKELFKKLSIIKNFQLKFGDIRRETEKWTSKMIECLRIARDSHGADVEELYKAYNMKGLGFSMDEISELL